MFHSALTVFTFSSLAALTAGSPAYLAGPVVAAAPTPTKQVAGVVFPGLSFPGLVIPGISLPSIALPGFGVPPFSIGFPAASVNPPDVTPPAIALPSINLPHISLPSIALPHVSLPSIGIEIPSIAPPAVTPPAINLPSIGIPNIVLPPLPSLPIAFPPIPTPPGIVLPSIRLPPIGLPSDLPHLPSPSSSPPTGGPGSTDSTPLILSFLRSTIAEVRDRTLAINTTLSSVNSLDVNFASQRANALIKIKAEVTVISYAIAKLNADSILQLSESVADLPNMRAQLAADVEELVMEITYTLKGALTKLQTTIWGLLGPEVLVLMAALGQLFTILNVFADGFMKLALGLMNAQIGVLNNVFAGVMTYAVDAAGSLFASLSKFMTCLLS